MSKPNYLRNDNNSPISVIVAIETLLKYIYTITNNDKQFPKSYRYTLVSELRMTILKIHTITYRAISIKPKYKEQYNKRVKMQHKVYMKLIDLKGLILVAISVAHINNLEQLTLLMEDVMASYMRWMKNDKRLYKHLPTKSEYDAEYARRERSRREWDQFKKQPRDSDGFVVLNRRD